MDPRHTLYRTFETLTVDPETLGNMSATTEQETAKTSSGVTAEGIERKLKEGLGAVYVEIADLSGMFVLEVLIVLLFCLFLSHRLNSSLISVFSLLGYRLHHPATSALGSCSVMRKQRVVNLPAMQITLWRMLRIRERRIVCQHQLALKLFCYLQKQTQTNMA
jgi:hypothetical protein